jgi:hypothetical protein
MHLCDAWPISLMHRTDGTARRIEANEPAQLHYDQPHRDGAAADLDPVAALSA